MITEPDGQSLLEFVRPKCDVCPISHEGLCRGPSTGGSFEMEPFKAIGCFSSALQARRWANLKNTHAWAKRGAPSAPTTPVLPRFLPVLEDGLPSKRILEEGWVGLSLGTLLTSTGLPHYRTERQLRRALRIGANVRICLLGSCADPPLEAMWRRSQELEIWKRFRDLGISLSTTTTCSVYDSHPRFDQVYNQRRNLASYDLLVREGIPVVPFLFAYAEEDYELAAQWLDEHPEVTTVGVLAQRYRSELPFSKFFERIKRLRDHLNRPVRYLVLGAGTPRKILQLYAEFRDVVIATTKPVSLGRSGVRLLGDLVEERSTAPHEVLITENIGSFSRYCSFAEASASSDKGAA